MNVLIVVAHPDDEALGAGGTLARHSQNGDHVSIVILADGESSRHGYHQDGIMARQQSAARAAQALGARAPQLLGLPDNALDSLPLLHVVQKLEPFFRSIKPAIVYTHHPHDLNIDHRIVANAVLIACRPISGSPVRAIYTFETASSTEWSIPGALAFSPRRFVDISATLNAKIAALQCYDSEMRQFPHPRSYEAVEALARWRGATVGLAAAEAFEVQREIAFA
jgi:LmbE family N-acetylglucosaminyl deacetylase